MSAEFFETIYARADGDDGAVPWQDAISRPFVEAWLQRFVPTDHTRAIVVAAGLGDDAAALAARNLEVIAFDSSPTAVDWARTRHPDAPVEWHVADLFATPSGWTADFDLVLEVFTVQSIEPARQAEAATAIRSLVAPGGTLVAVALVHGGEDVPAGPPWPVHPSTVTLLVEGFTETHRHAESVGDDVSCVIVEATRA